MTRTLLFSLSILALLSSRTYATERDVSTLQPTPLDVLKPLNTGNGTYNSQTDVLTCDILLSQNMVYALGQTEDYCSRARDSCYTTGLIKQTLSNANNGSALPNGMTLDLLNKNLNTAAALEEINLTGCRLAIAATQGGVMQPDTVSLPIAAGYFRN